MLHKEIRFYVIAKKCNIVLGVTKRMCMSIYCETDLIETILVGFFMERVDLQRRYMMMIERNIVCLRFWMVYWRKLL